ncbi:hypothetical protein, partial [Staphylococcus aureus]|uniref:hypothetical protein n=1 Tax=Staphylococcus aureus TaxID=1280 RepID=UPI001C8ECB2D
HSATAPQVTYMCRFTSVTSFILSFTAEKSQAESSCIPSQVKTFLRDVINQMPVLDAITRY